MRLLRRDAPRFTVVRASSVSEAGTLLETRPVDVVLLDLGLPDSQGLDTLDAIRAHAPRVPIVVITGRTDDGEPGVEAVRRGAQDYVIKSDLDAGVLYRVLRYAVERQQAEERLRREGNLLQQTQRLAGAWEYDVERGRVIWSEEVYRIHEVPLGTEIKVEDALDFYAPDCRSVIQAAVQRAIEEGIPYDLELTIITAKGHRRDVRAVGAPVEEEGTVVRLAGAFQDITARKEAERELQQALTQVRHEREQLRTIFEQTPSFLAVLRGPDHIFEYTNERYQRLIGHRDVLGKPVREALPEVAEQGFVDLLDQVYATGEAFHADSRPIWLQREPHGDPERRCVGFVYQPLRRSDGSVRGILVQGVDVTERFESEQQAKKARRTNQLILSNIPDVVCTVDMDRRFARVNPASKAVWGYTPEELEGRRYINFVHPDDVDATVARSQEIREAALKDEDHGPFTFENRYVRKDGSVCTMQWSTVWSEEDELLYCVARDVTEQRKREQRLQLLATSVAETHEAIVITDAELEPPGPRIVFVNEAFSRMTGYAADEVIGKTPRLLQGPETDRAVLDRLRADLQQGEDFEGEAVNYRKDGTPYVVNWSITPVRDDDGAVNHFVSVQRDVTEQREAERQQARLAAIVESSDDAIYSMHLDGTVTSWNAGAEQLYGFAADEIVGQSIHRILPEDRKNEAERIEASIRQGAPVSMGDTIRMHKDGALIPVALTVSPVRDRDGRVIGASAIARDITERKQAERELIEAKEEAERMNALKSAFLANMSHEIRTPLTSITGYAELLREEAESGLTAEFVDMIHRGGRRLERTLNSVLALSQIESATLELEWSRCDVGVLIQETVEQFSKPAKEKGLRLHAVVPEHPVLVRTDRDALLRVLNNLTSNAIKFTRDGHVSLGAAVGEDGVVLWVQDTGVGIGDSYREHLFEPFTQESAGLSRDYEGVGIGLTITRRLVDLLGGRLDVDSEKGTGSTFTVTIPVGGPAKTSQEDVRQSPPGEALESAGATLRRFDDGKGGSLERGKNLRILVVEDHEETRHYLRILLEEQHEVVAVATPEEALEAARRAPLDIAIIDVNLRAHLTGEDVMEQLRAMPMHAQTPTIACTAYALPGDAERLLQAGFDGYLAKPFRKNDLYRAVTDLVDVTDLDR